jgi:tetratricopeptide (TPR) repeat protein
VTNWKSEQNKQRLLFSLSFLLSLGIYLLTLSPTVTAEDSGELITAAYTLGIAHPPGYPLWCLLGKLFTLVIPLGSVAYRVNLLSSVLGSLAVSILSLLALRFTKSFHLSLLGALLYAFSRDFWSQCVIAEIYSLNVLFFLLMIWLLLKFEDLALTRYLYLSASVYGLSLTNHSTMGPLGIIFFGFVFLRNRHLLRDRVLLLNLLAAFLLGFSIVLYLPIRSALDPVMDWGNPESLEGTLEHLLRRQYTAAEVPRPRTLPGQLILVGQFLWTFLWQFTPVLSLLAPFGAFLHVKREKATFILFGLLFGATSYGFIWLLNYPPDRQNLFLSQTFFLPAHAIGALWITIALKALKDRLRGHFEGRLPFPSLSFSGVSAGLILIPLLGNYRTNDRSDYYWARDWGENILATLKENSIVLPTADHSTFPLIYLTAVEGLRPDVVVGDKYGYIEDRLFRDLFRNKRTPPIPPPFNGTELDKERYLIEYSDRPVYFTTNNHIPGLNSFELRTSGLIFEAVSKSKKPEEEEAHKEIWSRYRWHPGTFEKGHRDFSADMILSDYHYACGRYELLFGRKKPAIEALRLSEKYGFGIKEIHNNLGGTLAEAGEPEIALQFLRYAIEIDRGYDLAIKNLASCHVALGRYKEGYTWLKEALELEPNRPEWLLGFARALDGRGEYPEAARVYLQFEKLTGANPEILREMAAFFLVMFGDRERANYYFERAEAMDQGLVSQKMEAPPEGDVFDDNTLARLPDDENPLSGASPGPPVDPAATENPEPQVP